LGCANRDAYHALRVVIATKYHNRACLFGVGFSLISAV
jgi:hypothetical protein